MEDGITQTMGRGRQWRFLWCYLALGLITSRDTVMGSSIITAVSATPSSKVVNETASSVFSVVMNTSAGAISSSYSNIIQSSITKTPEVTQTLSNFTLNIEPTKVPTVSVTATLSNVDGSTTDANNDTSSSDVVNSFTNSAVKTLTTNPYSPSESYLTTSYLTSETRNSLTTDIAMKTSFVANVASVSENTLTSVLSSSTPGEQTSSSSPLVESSVVPTIAKSEQSATQTPNISKTTSLEASSSGIQPSYTVVQSSVSSVNIETYLLTTGTSRNSRNLVSSESVQISMFSEAIHVSPSTSLVTDPMTSRSQTYSPLVLSQTTGLYSISEINSVLISTQSTSLPDSTQSFVSHSVNTTGTSSPFILARQTESSPVETVSSSPLQRDMYSSQPFGVRTESTSAVGLESTKTAAIESSSAVGGIESTTTLAIESTSAVNKESTIVVGKESTTVVESTISLTSLQHFVSSIASGETSSLSTDTLQITSAPLSPTATLIATSSLETSSASLSNFVSISPSSSKDNTQTSTLPESRTNYTAATQNATVTMSTPAHDSTTSTTPKYTTKKYVPVVAVNMSFEIEFEGICDPLVQRKIVLEEFWGYLVVALSRMLLVERVKIKPKDIACNPIRITFTILEIDHPNITHVLTDFVADGRFKFQLPVILEDSEAKFWYTATSVKIVPTSYDLSSDGERYELGLSEVDIIVIISACCISVILICVGCCICVREYYLRKRSRSFDLSDIVNFNLKLEDYTLTKIPRTKPFYSDGGVKMQSFTRKNGHQAKALLDQDDNSTDDNINENGHLVKELQVRMNEHSDGILIGITKSNLQSVNMNSPDLTSCDLTDQSKEVLYEHHASPTHCMDNPIYFADDDRFSNV